MPKTESSGRYQVALELWRGDLGVLSVGHSPGRAVFLRRLETKPPWTDALLDGLAASAESARAIHHPSLLAVIDRERTSEGLTVATEYVQGVPLMTLVARAKERRRPMPPPVAQRIVLDLARALAATEEILKSAADPRVASWIHPECVFISSGDDALIGDAGMIALGDVPEHPAIVAYRAPELLARGARPTHGAPVYSLGILLWELLAGRDALGQAAPGASLASVRQRAAGGGIPRLDLVTRNLPSLLVEITMQSVHRDPRARFPTVKAFADALAAVKRVRGGELVAYMNELCSDLVDRQRAALVHTSIAPASWRPTVHALESEPPQIPRAPRLIGLAAYMNPSEPEHVEVSVESSRRGPDQLLPPAGAPGADAPPRELAPMQVAAAEAIPLGAAQEQRSTLPLLLVQKAPETGPSFSSVDGTTSFDPDTAFRPRRRWGLLLFVLLILGGAGALIVFAVQKQLAAANGGAPSTPADGVPAASQSGAGVLPGTTPATSASGAAQRARLQRERAESASKRREAKDGAAAASSPSAGENEPDFDNPYVTKPTPSAAPSAAHDRGF